MWELKIYKENRHFSVRYFPTGDEQDLTEFLKFYLDTTDKTTKEFLATIRSVKRITLVSEKDLFNQSDYELPLIKNFGSPSSYELNVDFSAERITDKVVFALQRLTDYVKKGRYQKLVCIGDAGGDLERVFNSETFIERIKVQVAKNDSNGMYDPDTVMTEFINHVVRMQYVEK